jgi:SMODS-associated and fused to various effectors sensor domain
MEHPSRELQKRREHDYRRSWVHQKHEWAQNQFFVEWGTQKEGPVRANAISESWFRFGDIELVKTPVKQMLISSVSGIREETTRTIGRSIESMLWGRAAGRCEFAGCNKVLSRSSVTKEQVNTAEKAHIYSFSADGPRGHEGVTKEELNNLDNLILVCHECHRLIDGFIDGGKYSATSLRDMKTSHERRIELVTGIAPELRSHVVFYGANVGEHSSPFVFNDAVWAMIPERNPADHNAIALGITDSFLQDKTPEYWKSEATGLLSQFNQRVRDLVSQRKLDHLSVFALAPQPLLILLGTLLGDIVPADIYQRHREPPTWSWPSTAPPLVFEVQEPKTCTGLPALVLGLSATVTRDRIESVLGPEASVWNVTVPQPGNDLIKSREHLSQFRSLMRELFNRIKAAHGQTTLLHVFPVAAVSAAVEFGRVRMPKADMPWCIYDQNNWRGGFVETLSIPLGA